MTDTLFSPVRASSVYVPDEQLHLIPMLRNFLIPSLGNLPDVMHFTASGLAPRTSPPSGYFSPSTHPTWSLRDLVLYAMEPTYVPPDQKAFSDDTQISALMGTIFHVIFNYAFREMGILVAPPEKSCPLCHKPRGYKAGVDTCNEHVVIDEKLKRRGHVDGVVKLPDLGTIPIDVKTCAHQAIKWINNHDAQPFIEAKAGSLKAKYYGQAQEYLAMRDEDMLMFVYIGLGYPWEMREIIIKRDQPYIDALQAKYKLAREMASRREIPPA